MNIQELSDLTANLLLQYYDNNITPFLEHCHEDVLWIGPAEGQMIRTKKTLVETFAAEQHSLRFAVHALKATPLSTGSRNSMNILLTFLVDTFWPDKRSNRVSQRILFTWSAEPEGPKIRLCHISNAIAYDNRDTIYPVHYLDSYKDMVLSSGETTIRIPFRGLDKTTLYLNYSRIIYMETKQHHTLIHTLDQTFESVERLSGIASRCTQMLRCHESYLVNPDYVQEICRFYLKLTNGTVIPIPEKKYTAVKNALQQSDLS